MDLPFGNLIILIQISRHQIQWNSSLQTKCQITNYEICSCQTYEGDTISTENTDERIWEPESELLWSLIGWGETD